MADIIVAGNTSGAITISAPLVAGSGTLTLPVATDTLVGKATTDTLTNKSIAATQLTGTIAAAALPAGSVLQVVQGTYATITTSSTSTFIDTGLTATITPKFSTSKILIFASHPGCDKGAANAGNAMAIRIYRNGGLIAYIGEYNGFTNTATTLNFHMSGSYYDSPATTSATTYKTMFASLNSNAAQVRAQADSVPSTITLMEIAV